MKDEVEFTVNVTGETTGIKFKGVFKAKTKLSFRDKLREDELRRSYLGDDPEQASAYAQSIAAGLARLNMRLVDAPDWWESGSGEDLEDDNVLAAVHSAMAEKIEKAYGSEKEKANKAKKDIKEAADVDEE